MRDGARAYRRYVMNVQKRVKFEGYTKLKRLINYNSPDVFDLFFFTYYV